MENVNKCYMERKERKGKARKEEEAIQSNSVSKEEGWR